MERGDTFKKEEGGEHQGFAFNTLTVCGRNTATIGL
jgi:hypothetical protein